MVTQYEVKYRRDLQVEEPAAILSSHSNSVSIKRGEVLKCRVSLTTN